MSPRIGRCWSATSSSVPQVPRRSRHATQNGKLVRARGQPGRYGLLALGIEQQPKRLVTLSLQIYWNSKQAAKTLFGVLTQGSQQGKKATARSQSSGWPGDAAQVALRLEPNHTVGDARDGEPEHGPLGEYRVKPGRGPPSKRREQVDVAEKKIRKHSADRGVVSRAEPGRATARETPGTGRPSVVDATRWRSSAKYRRKEGGVDEGSGRGRAALAPFRLGIGRSAQTLAASSPSVGLVTHL